MVGLSASARTCSLVVAAISYYITLTTCCVSWHPIVVVKCWWSWRWRHLQDSLSGDLKFL